MTTPTGNAGIPIQTMKEAAPAIFVVDAARVDQGLVLIGNSDTLAMPLTEGFSSTPAFAGWAPGSQGLFQVIAPVPAGVTPGPSIPLYLQVGLANGSAVPSNEV